MQHRLPQRPVRSDRGLRPTTPTRSTLNSQGYASEPASQSIPHRGYRVGLEVLSFNSIHQQHLTRSGGNHDYPPQPWVQNQAAAPIPRGGEHRFFEGRHLPNLPPGQGTQSTQMSHATRPVRPAPIRRQRSAPLYEEYSNVDAHPRLERQLNRSVSFQTNVMNVRADGSSFGTNGQQQAPMCRNGQRICGPSTTRTGPRILIHQNAVTSHHGQSLSHQGYPQRTGHQRGVQRIGELTDTRGQRQQFVPSFPVVANSQTHHYYKTPTNGQFKFHQRSNLPLSEKIPNPSQVRPGLDRAGSANQLVIRKPQIYCRSKTAPQSQEQSIAVASQRLLSKQQQQRPGHPPSRFPLEVSQHLELTSSQSQKTIHHRQEDYHNKHLPAVQNPQKQSTSGLPPPCSQEEPKTANNYENQRSSRRRVIPLRGGYEEVQRSISKLLSSNEFIDESLLEKSESDGEYKPDELRLSKAPIQNSDEPRLPDTTPTTSFPARRKSNTHFEKDHEKSTMSSRQKSESAPDDTTKTIVSQSTEQVHSEWTKDRAYESSLGEEEVHSSAEKETESSRLIQISMSRLKAQKAHGQESPPSAKSSQSGAEQMNELTRKKSKSRLSSTEDESANNRMDVPKRRKSGKLVTLKDEKDNKKRSESDNERTQDMKTFRSSMEKPTSNSRRSKFNSRTCLGENDPPVQQKEQEKIAASTRQKAEPQPKPGAGEPKSSSLNIEAPKHTSVPSPRKTSTLASAETRCARIVLLGEHPAASKTKEIMTDQCSAETETIPYQRRSERSDDFASPATPRNLEGRSPRLILLSPELQTVTRKKTQDGEKTPKPNDKQLDKFKTFSPRVILCPHSPRPCRKDQN